jgi:hypothetical protein
MLLQSATVTTPLSAIVEHAALSAYLEGFSNSTPTSCRRGVPKENVYPSEPTRPDRQLEDAPKLSA